MVKSLELAASLLGFGFILVERVWANIVDFATADHKAPQVSRGINGLATFSMEAYDCHDESCK